MSKVKIFISCHKKTDYIKSDIFTPIQLGCANAKSIFSDMLHDNEGENISDLNPMYCELTAQYWAWKNVDADYYGFCHYRRYFNFSDIYYDEDIYGNVIEGSINDSIVDKYALDDENVRKIVEAYDIIVTERKDINKMGGGFSSVINQWEKAKMLHNEDLTLLSDIIDEYYPQYSKYANKHLKGHITSFCNMYIIKKNIFERYNEWLFSILAEFCKRRDMTHYSTEALRTPGHLAERLFGIYYLYLMDHDPNIRVKEVQCVWFENTNIQKELTPAFQNNSIPIVFAANNNFVPMFATCFQSLLDNISSKYNYDVVLLHSDIDAINKETLQSMVDGYDNVSLRLYDVTKLVINYHLKANAHISVETYYRFLIQKVLPFYDKVLYVDCDTIINADLAELYETDVDGYMLAAVRDADFLGQINGANLGTKIYCENEFKMKDPYNYFQAGVILFNEKEMRKAYTLDEWLTFASTPYKYNDQDVLNLYCEGRVKYLDMAWNLITDCDHTRVANVIVFAPDYIQKSYAKAHANPKIIHYAGFMKPWFNTTEDYAPIFWEKAKRTPYYDTLLTIMIRYIIDRKIESYDFNTRLVNITKCKIKSVVRFFADKVFPKGTVRREKLKRMLGRV